MSSGVEIDAEVIVTAGRSELRIYRCPTCPAVHLEVHSASGAKKADGTLVANGALSPDDVRELVGVLLATIGDGFEVIELDAKPRTEMN